MEPTCPTRWPRELRSLQFGDLPIEQQLVRRRGVVRAVTALLVALIVFILAIFTGFGRWDIGAGLGGVLFGVPLGWIWWDYGRSCRAARRYDAAGPGPRADGPAAGRPSS